MTQTIQPISDEDRAKLRTKVEMALENQQWCTVYGQDFLALDARLSAAEARAAALEKGYHEACFRARDQAIAERDQARDFQACAEQEASRAMDARDAALAQAQRYRECLARLVSDVLCVASCGYCAMAVDRITQALKEPTDEVR